MNLRWMWVPVIGAFLMLVPIVAQAQAVDDATRRAARNLGVSGVESYEAKDYTTAHEKLEKAYQALRAPSLGLWSARALVKLGKLVEAAERYQEVVRLEVAGGERAVQEQAKADAARELDQLSPQIPSVVIELIGAKVEQVKVSINGSTVSPALIGERLPVNPGRHALQAASAGQTTSAEVELAVGQTKNVTLRFDDLPPGGKTDSAQPGAAATPLASDARRDEASKSTGSSRRTLAVVALGTGGAGVVLGAVTGLLALRQKSEIDSNPQCKNNNCLRSEASLVDGYNTLRTVSGVGLIAGTAALAVGVVILVSAPKASQATALHFGPSRVALSRSF